MHSGKKGILKRTLCVDFVSVIFIKILFCANRKMNKNSIMNEFRTLASQLQCLCLLSAGAGAGGG